MPIGARGNTVKIRPPAPMCLLVRALEWAAPPSQEQQQAGRAKEAPYDESSASVSLAAQQRLENVIDEVLDEAFVARFPATTVRYTITAGATSVTRWEKSGRPSSSPSIARRSDLVVFASSRRRMFRISVASLGSLRMLVSMALSTPTSRLYTSRASQPT
ncbi:hypothetical protein [Streptomyces sp. NPDC019507]|uniref:hypothetical protein n=1 Tax=Streptomyces sp. NPDC019507 TaxID=3154689 RepID=UPI003404E687